MDLSETFRIDVNMNFANIDIYYLGPQNIFRPKSKKPRVFWILGWNFIGGLNQKSTMISICEIHIYPIYIDSKSFKQIHGKM